MKTLSNTTTFNNLLKALDTGMVVYIKDGNNIYNPLGGFGYVLKNNIPTIAMGFYNLSDRYEIMPSEVYSDSDLYIPTNFILSEPVVK